MQGNININFKSYEQENASFMRWSYSWLNTVKFLHMQAHIHIRTHRTRLCKLNMEDVCADKRKRTECAWNENENQTKAKIKCNGICCFDSFGAPSVTIVSFSSPFHFAVYSSYSSPQFLWRSVFTKKSSVYLCVLQTDGSGSLRMNAKLTKLVKTKRREKRIMSNKGFTNCFR